MLELVTGRYALRSVRSQRDAWLASAIERELDEEELAVLTCSDGFSSGTGCNRGALSRSVGGQHLGP